MPSPNEVVNYDDLTEAHHQALLDEYQLAEGNYDHYLEQQALLAEDNNDYFGDFEPFRAQEQW